jgi:MFS family permease
VALAQFAGALSRPSQGAMLPSLVSDRALARANSTYWLLFGTSMFVAPAIGAVILLHTGPDLLFGIDAATFVISAVLAATLPSGHLSNADAAATGAVHLNAASDLRLGLRDPVIRVVAAANFASGLAVTVTQALLVVAAHERLGGDVAVGYLYSGVGIGATVGGIIALRATPPRPWVRLAVFVVVVAELVFLAGFSAVFALAAALALLALSSLVGSSFDIWGVTEVQRRAPPGYMGRFNAVIWISQYAGLLVGALWALGTATLLHWDVAIQVACAACLVLIGAVWLSGGKSVMAG